MYFAYDTPDDYEPLVEAGNMLRAAGITEQSHVASCYCLIGYQGDTFDKAQERMEQAIKAGFMPYAMLYRDEQGKTDREWARFQREWLRPAIVSHMLGEVWKNEHEPANYGKTRRRKPGAFGGVLMLSEKERALLGDREAQEAFTARGELLPCPCCGKQPRHFGGASIA